MNSEWSFARAVALMFPTRRRPRAGFLVRLRARCDHCLFVDVVNGREVWLYVDRAGGEWMGQSRFGFWTPRGGET